ncbi:MAG: GspE/PulE family protein [Parcubacteria group bacterium]|nr:GspE/PulE family protein [Parcubacteria group bacterium]MCR4342758.1 GspE/PulE family protein [Patescibacteria group bacterium]
MSFVDVLIKNNFITQEDLPVIYKEMDKSGLSLEQALIVKGVREEDIVSAKGQDIGVPIKEVDKTLLSFDILKIIPEEIARQYKMVPIEVNDSILEVGMLDPQDINAREALQFIVSKLNLSFKVFLVSQSDFDMVLDAYKGLRGEVTKVLGEIEVDPLLGSVNDSGNMSQAEAVEDAPITKMVAVILRHATEGNASDIHIEPWADKLKVRFREDGVLYTSLLLPSNVHDSIVARIKILSNLKIDEKRKPQDGRFSVKMEGRQVDFRVSTFPSFFGEKVVIRILDRDKGVKSLEEVGLSGRNLEAVKRAIKSPYGMILLTGPTGSGKTTTLYAMLQSLDREKNNIISLEDPVEYNVEGVSQSQVRPEIGYTFANGLRSVLRQDPDIIMVGEIRDKETAQLAIQAALTGHLVLSTLHTNSAVGVIPRLVDMGVDPYLLAPTLVLAIGQRLVQTLCPESKKEMPMTDSLRAKLEKELEGVHPDIRSAIKIPDKIYQAMPSSSCPRGTRGRAAVFEMFEKTKDIEEAIVNNPVENEIMAKARKNGMLTMREDAVLKVFDGTIGFEEIYKV